MILDIDRPRNSLVMSLATRRPSFTTYQELSEYRNLFSCLICLELFTNPRILDCNHIFCEQCIQSYYALFRTVDPAAGTLQGASLSCPTCRKLTSMSVGSPAPLSIPECKVPDPPPPPRRRKVSRNSDALLKCDSCYFLYKQEIADFYCSKCVMNFCKTCRLAHDQHPLFKGHFVIHVSNKETLDLYCDLHSKMTSLYFCLDCNLPVCVICILHDHATHNTTKLREALTMRRDHLKTLLNDFGPRLDKVEAAIKTLEALYESETQPVTTDAAGLRNDRRHASLVPPDYETVINDPSLLNGMVRSKSSPAYCAPSFHDIIASIAKSRGEGHCDKDQLQAKRTSPPPSALWSDRLRGGGESKASLGQCQQVDGSCNGKSSSTETTVFVFPPRQSVSGKQKYSLGSRFRQNEIIPTEEVIGKLLCDRSSGRRRRRDGRLQAIVNQVQRHRKLFNLSTKILDMSQSKKLFAIYEDMVDRIKTVLEVEVKYLLEELAERTEAEKTRKMAKSVVDSTHHLEDSACSSVRSSKTGYRTRLLNADGTPLSMLTRPKLVWKIEKQRSDVGEMWNPCDVTFLADDTVIVAEYDSVNERNNKLQVFDTTGKSLAVLAQGQIRPLGVAITREGNIAVTDCRGKRVKIMTQAGNTVTDIGKGQFGWPYGIAVNSRGQLIVTDAFNDTVSIYQTDGKRVKIFGSTGSQHSHFRNPYHVTVDARDNIIVSDSGNNAIKVFDPSGKFLFYTTDAMRRPSVDLPSDRKVKRRTLKGPRGIAVDLNGNMLVADDCCRVCMFDSSGRYLRNLLNEEDSVKYPEAIECSRKGLLAVTEWNPNNMFAIKVFTMYE